MKILSPVENFQILQYLAEIHFKILGKKKNLKSPAGFVLMTYKFVVSPLLLTFSSQPLNPLRYALSQNFGKETFYEITHYFNVYFDKLRSSEFKTIKC